MSTRQGGNLRLGPDVVRRLLPHRRPFLMVDGIVSFERDPLPRLSAFRNLSCNEELFAGHLGALSLWPGVFTIEGLGQSCQILETLLAMERAWTHLGEEAEDVLSGLGNLELGCRLHPGYDPEKAARFLERLRKAGRPIGLLSSVEIKFMQPVFAGQRLDYLVTRTHDVGAQQRFEVEACVEGKVVAAGLIISTKGFSLPDMEVNP